ncbi:MAG: GAF domain-containing protein [Anaerolineales bacterium]|nr:GAF domain-containing protein [Anaerolineales bacterium]
MNQTPPSPATHDADYVQQTSLGVKLTVVVIGLLLFAFIAYTFISIRISQGDIAAKTEKDLRVKTDETALQIQDTLAEARNIASNLAVAIENGTYTENNLQTILRNVLQRNKAFHGAIIAYDIKKFDSKYDYWAPYYYYDSNNLVQFAQLGGTGRNTLGQIQTPNYAEKDWFTLPKKTSAPVLLSPYREPDYGNAWITTWGVPFFDKEKNFKGVVAIEINLKEIQQPIADFKMGEASYAMLINPNGTLIGVSQTKADLQPMTDTIYTAANLNPQAKWTTVIEKMTAGESGLTEALDKGGAPIFVSYAPIGMDTGWSLALVYPRSEITRQSRQLQTSLLAYSLVLSLVFGFIIFFFTRTITSPLEQLTKVAEEISSGNLDVTASAASSDEVGALAHTVNRMTRQLRDTYDNLEKRITERTIDLEIARRQTEIRAGELLSISEISKTIASERRLETLLPLIAHLVSERFDFYHVGIFLVDSSRQYAVLQAANSSGGQAMLKRGHRLKIGEVGLVGFAAYSGSPRIALDVGHDAVFFDNPNLPNTRSEIALPLKIHENVVGVLDVQSEKPGAFSEENANILSILADQAAVAIENARLLQQARRALDESKMAYQRTTQENWAQFIQDEPIIGYQQTMRGGAALSQPINSNDLTQTMERGQISEFHADGKTGDPTLIVPIKLREQTIGAMKIIAPSQDRLWTGSEINLAEAVAERLSLALENARLIEESQRQVVKEQTISEVTGRIGSSINLENVLLAAVEEIGRNIPGSEVTVKLKAENQTAQRREDQP